MTITRRTTLTAGLALAALIAAVFTVASWVLMNGFLRVERTLTERNVRRACDSIAGEVTHLSTKLSDWAAWDDTYQFIEDRNSAYVESNLGRQSLINLGLSFIVFLDTSGELVHGVAVGDSPDEPADVPPALLELVRSGDALFQHDREESAKGGLLVLGGRCALVASRPILTSESTGPVRGTLVFGSWFDGAALDGLARRLLMTLDVRPLDRGVEIAPPATLARLRAGAAIDVVPASDGAVRGYAEVFGAHGEPAAVVRTGSPRFVYVQARRSLMYLLGALLLTGTAGTVAIVLVLRRVVLLRLTRLSEAVSGIGPSLDLARRVPEVGNDEVTVLEREINALLAHVERAQEALAESETRFRTMADSAPVLIWVTDPKGNCTYLNRAWREFTGGQAEAHLGEGWAKLIHPDDLPALREAWRRDLEHRRPFTFEYRLRRHDGAYRWVHVRGGPRFGPDGVFEGFIGACSDVTESREAAARLHRQAEDLTRAKTLLEAQAAELESARLAAEAANRAKDDFLANMSHEIRTPMTAILGYADLLADPSLSASERLSCVETVRRNGEHLLALINDILDLSKIEAGRMGVESRECAPMEIVDDVASLMRLRTEAKGIDLRVERIGALPALVRLDPVRYRQILVNLVGNAVKFTEAGEVRVIARAVPGDGSPGWLHVEVRDSGIGMTADQVSRLFRPFTQGDTTTTRRFGGTGLGLSISKTLAELMGGRIDVESTPGEGSRFTLVVPLPEPWAPAPPAPAEGAGGACPPVPNEAAGIGDLAGAAVLLVEDGPDNRRLISHYLTRAGARVETAENGREAVERAAARRFDRPYDVVLMDMQMPEVDGYEATRRLRREGYGGAIIALTAHAMEGERERCSAAGCDDFLVKPLECAAFLRTCAGWRGRRSPHAVPRPVAGVPGNTAAA